MMAKILATMEEVEEQFPFAIKTLKKSMHLLVELEASEALAAISVKMVDAFEAVTNSNPGQALTDVWGCSYAIQRTIYLSMVDLLKKESDIAAVAEDAAKAKDYQKATFDYCKANAEVTQGCGYNALFLEFNEG